MKQSLMYVLFCHDCFIGPEKCLWGVVNLVHVPVCIVLLYNGCVR